MAFKKIFLLIAVIGVVLPVFVFAQNFGLQDAVRGTDLIGSNESVNANQALPELIGTIVGVVLSFVGAIFFLLILYAGLLWMMAFGNSERVDRAKSIVEHAAVGLVIVLAAYAISRFVFSALTNPASTANNSSSGSAQLGCCYVTTPAFQDLQGNQIPESCTPNQDSMSEQDCATIEDISDSTVQWRVGACNASCP